MKGIEQYFHVVMFIMLYKVVLTFKSVDETLVCGYSNESCWAVLSCGTVYYTVQGSNFKVCGWNPSVWPFKWKLLSSTFMWHCSICLYKIALTSKSVDETLVCGHSNESYWAVLSCGTVRYAVQCGSNFKVCGWSPSAWPFKWKLLSSTFMWHCSICCTRLL